MLTTSGELAWNANAICREVEQGTSEMDLRSELPRNSDMYAAQEAELCPLLSFSHSRVPTVPLFTCVSYPWRMGS